jgi:DNA invertase Pin-like site-specific DNA recombinase
MGSKKPTIQDEFLAIAATNKCRLLNKLESLTDKVEFECLDCRTQSSGTTFKLRKTTWCVICEDDPENNNLIKKVLIDLKIKYKIDFTFEDHPDIVFDFFLEEGNGFVIIVDKGNEFIDFAKEQGVALIEVSKDLLSDPNQLKTALKSAVKDSREYQSLKLKDVAIGADGFKRYPNLKISDKDFDKYFDNWNNIEKEKVRKIGSRSKSFIYQDDILPGKKIKLFKCYCRISTSHQQDNNSMMTQFTGARSWAEKEGRLTAAYFDFSISGKNIDTRPGIMQLRMDIKDGEILLIANSSRLGRNFAQITALKDEFMRKNVEVITIDDGLSTKSPQGIVIGQMKDVLSEQQRKTMAENTIYTMGIMSAEGRLRSKTTFGWTFKSKEEDLEKNEDEQQVIALIRQMCTDNKFSLSSICRRLDDMKIKHKGAKRWYVTTLKLLLVREGIPFKEYDPSTQRVRKPKEEAGPSKN